MRRIAAGYFLSSRREADGCEGSLSNCYSTRDTMLHEYNIRARKCVGMNSAVVLFGLLWQNG